MKELFIRIREWNSYFTEAEEVYETLKQRGEPTPLLVILPIIYRNSIVKNRKEQFIEPAMLFYAGKMLSYRYPQLSKYFADPEAEREITKLEEEVRTALESSLEEKL